MAAPAQDADLVLYHRTNPEAAEEIMQDRSMVSKENTDEVYLSNRPEGTTDGYGSAIVQLRVPADLAELAEEFPDGEQHYRVRAGALRSEHFVATWIANPEATPEQMRALADAELRAQPDVERYDQSNDVGPVAVADSAGITPADLTLAINPEPLQVDLHLGEAVYRQAAARGGFTPESTAAAEVTIEQAVASRQAVSTADRLHALAGQVETSHNHRATQAAATPPVRPVPVAPPPRSETARARAVSAQIWDDTRDEYDAPTVAERLWPAGPRPDGLQAHD